MTDSQKKLQEILKETAITCDVPIDTVIEIINYVSKEVKLLLNEVLNGRYIDSINFSYFGKLCIKKKFKAFNFPDEPSNNPKYVAWLLSRKRHNELKRLMEDEMEDRQIEVTPLEENYEFIGNVYN